MKEPKGTRPPRRSVRATKLSAPAPEASPRDDLPAASVTPGRLNPWARHRARRLILQAIYQWQLSEIELFDLIAQFAENEERAKIDFTFFKEVVTGVVIHHADLDSRLSPFLDRAVTALDEVERAILRMGAFELTHRIDVPVKTAIDEAVGLALGFGATGSHSYVNGVLDRFARTIRSGELSPLSDPLSDHAASRQDPLP